MVLFSSLRLFISRLSVWSLSYPEIWPIGHCWLCWTGYFTLEQMICTCAWDSGTLSSPSRRLEVHWEHQTFRLSMWVNWWPFKMLIRHFKLEFFFQFSCRYNFFVIALVKSLFAIKLQLLVNITTHSLKSLTFWPWFVPDPSTEMWHEANQVIH